MHLSDLPQPIASLVQRGLSSLNLYDGTFKGRPGPKTEAAYKTYLDLLDTISPDQSPDADLIETFVQVALGEIGVKEIGKTNTGKRVEEYQAATSLKGTGWPWCAAFICWCLKTSMDRIGAFEWSRPTTALAYGFDDWAKDQGLDYRFYPGNDIERGDIVALDNTSHVGVATSSPVNGLIDTVEGNTNVAGSRDGGGVYAKKRRVSNIRSRVRLNKIKK